jgi:hypothetical protein
MLAAETARADSILKAMAISRKQIIPDALSGRPSPIQYMTENGFSIIRLSEVDGSVIDTARECHFLVRSEGGWEREVAVHFEEGLVAQIQRQRRTHLSDTSVLWLVCAERCLATYLSENDDYPRGGQLTISELPVDEFVLATHWNDQEDQ